MGMIRAEKLVFEYGKRDEDGNVIGSCRAIDRVPEWSFRIRTIRSSERW